MKKLFLFFIGLTIPVVVLAAGAGGGGSGIGDTSGFLAPSIVSVPVEEKKAEPKKPEVVLPPVRTHFCYTVPKLQQRIECRLGLSEEDLAVEYATQYLPEECRALPKKQQGACVERYEALQPCWETELGDERIACAREVLGIADDLGGVRKSCLALPKKQQGACLTQLRQNVYHLVKFRFYDLNERVEEFLHENPEVDGRPGIQFIVASELNKQKFNAARTKASRLQIIKNERTAWKRFVQAVHLDDTRDFLDDATKELSSVE